MPHAYPSSNATLAFVALSDGSVGKTPLDGLVLVFYRGSTLFAAVQDTLVGSEHMHKSKKGQMIGKDGTNPSLRPSRFPLWLPHHSADRGNGLHIGSTRTIATKPAQASKASDNVNSGLSICGDTLAMGGVSSPLPSSAQGSVFPGKVPLLGHLPVFLWALWRANGNLASAFERLFQQVNQQTFRVKLGPQWFILTIAPDIMHHILVTEFSRHPKTQHEREVLHPSLAGGLITAEGEEWKAHRQIFRPFFGTDSLQRLTVVAREAVTERVSQWQGMIDVGYEMQIVTFDIIARFFLGGKIGHYEEEKSVDFYVQHLKYIEKGLESRVLLFPHIQDSLRRSFKLKTRFDKSLRALQDFLAYRIRKSADDEQSILQEILKSFGSKDIVIQEMLNIIAASLGSAHVLTWICALLAQDPSKQKKLQTEIEHFFHERKDKSEITLAHLDQFSYLSAVIHEGLRLYSPAPYLLRTLEARPAAPLLILSLWSMHRHPALWTQPEAFEPERWLVPGDTTEASPDTARRLRACAAFLPFGAGPRMCIGRGFALVEIKLILLDIMRRFALRLVDPVLPPAKATLLTRPQRRICLEVVPVTDMHEV